MTATNHALTGAVVALAIKEPLLVLPLAILSHFILDALPHFGIHEEDHEKRNSHWLFRTVVSIDTVVVISMLVAVPLLANAGMNGWIILLGMLGGLSPDFVWIYRHIRLMLKKPILPYGKISSFHQRIQWFERPWGLPVEFGWMIGALLVINGLAA